MQAAVLIAIAAASIVLMLLRPRGIAEVWWVSAGALLLVVLRLISPRDAGHAAAKGSDVYFFLLGMMLLSELAREQGVFDWVSSLAVAKSHGSPRRLFAITYAVGTLVTIAMSNDATAVVLTPAILAAVRRAKAEPLPYLFVCAMVANAASFVLPISNPANLVVFHSGMPPLGQWLTSFLLPSALSIVATYLVLRWLFRKKLSGNMDPDSHNTPLTPTGKLVLAGLAVVVAVLLACSAFHLDLGLPTCIAALVITGVVCARARKNPLRLATQISWSTLLLVAGLFILVEAIEQAGALRFTQALLAWAQQQDVAIGALSMGAMVAVANNFVNNLPLGLLAGATLQSAQVHGLLANAVLIGVDLGPNLSVTGSLATILWLIALRREDVHVSGKTFLKYGAIAMPVALFFAMAGALLLHLFIAK